MTPLFKKLNFKDQKQILILGSPESFQAEMSNMEPYSDILTELVPLNQLGFALVFVTQKVEIDQTISVLANQMPGDAVLWFAYPKGSSKRYSCDFNRDTGWENVGKAGFERVRMVAIDQDWSALRFRRVEFIKSMTRNTSMALTNEGKNRTIGT